MRGREGEREGGREGGRVRGREGGRESEGVSARLMKAGLVHTEGRYFT